MYYFNARWYDPQLGRFITEDPVKDGVNWFSYANQNPLRYTDPTGLRADDDIEEDRRKAQERAEEETRKKQEEEKAKPEEEKKPFFDYTRHEDLTGYERALAEVGDIFTLQFYSGLGIRAQVSVNKVLDVGFTLDAGSQTEKVENVNFGEYDTASLGVNLSLGYKELVGIGVGASMEITAEIERDAQGNRHTPILKNLWGYGQKVEKDRAAYAAGAVGPLSFEYGTDTSESGARITVGGEVQALLGMRLEVDVTEIGDAIVQFVNIAKELDQ